MLQGRSAAMRTGFACALLFTTLAILTGCGPWLTEATAIEVHIVTQPQGGTYVNTVTCTFSAQNYYPEDTPVSTKAAKIKVQWFANGTSHKTETLTYAGSSYSLVWYTTTFSAPVGMYLDKAFKVRITYPGIGGESTLESNEAVCTVP
jgi:hypothetical protein